MTAEQLRLDDASLAAVEENLQAAARQTADNAPVVGRFESVTGIADVTHGFLVHVEQMTHHLSSVAELAAAVVHTITREGAACDAALSAVIRSPTQTE